MESSTEVLLGKEGPFCLLVNHSVGNGCAMGRRRGDEPHHKMLHWQVGFKDWSFLPCTPAPSEIGHAAFLSLIPMITTPWNCLGFVFKLNSDAAQLARLPCTTESQGKEGEKRKEKNQFFTENMKEVATRDSLVGSSTNITLAKKACAVLLPVRIFS